MESTKQPAELTDNPEPGQGVMEKDRAAANRVNGVSQQELSPYLSVVAKAVRESAHRPQSTIPHEHGLVL